MSEQEEEDLFELAPDADEKTRARFNGTVAKMMVAWGSIMTRTEADGTVSIILPPEFRGFPSGPPA